MTESMTAALVAIGALSAVTGSALAGPGPEAVALERGRRLSRWLVEGRVDSVASRLATDYRERLGGPAGVARAVEGLAARLGRERELLAEEAFTRMREDHYYRVARFTKTGDRSVTLHWAWDEEGRIVYLRARPTPEPASIGTDDYRTKTELSLPFQGRWYVFWGGRAPRRNHHVTAPTQRFAYDFVVLADGRTHAGDGASNGDYYCYGKAVLAPAPGRIVTAVDSVEENTPGEMNEEAPPGNYVVVDHGDGERSLLAHLRHGSVTVEVGDQVERGTEVGECGNSGRSSEPHLHYHLQTGDAFGEGAGLPASFVDYVADGEAVGRGAPVRDQLVRPSGRGREAGSRAVGSRAAEDGALPADFHAGLVDLVPETPSGDSVRFCTDTGGGVLGVREGVARRLGWLEEGEAATTIPFPSFRTGAAIPGPGAGPATLHVFPDTARIPLLEACDGFLGARWFAGRSWTLDYPAGELRRLRGGLPDSMPGERVPLGFQVDSTGERTSHFPRIEVAVAGDTLSMLLDTGAQARPSDSARRVLDVPGDTGGRVATSFVVASVFERWHREHPDWRVLEGAGTLGGGQPMIRVPAVELGELAVGPVWFTRRPDRGFQRVLGKWMDRPVQGALGGSALRHLRMTISYPDAVAVVARPGS